MRAREFINEARDAGGHSAMRPDVLDTLPDSHFWPELDNSSGYLAYRFGVAMAGMPDYPMDVAGPTGLKMVTISYSDAERDILDSTAKLMKTKQIRLSPKGSNEPADTHKVSPISNWMSKK